MDKLTVVLIFAVFAALSILFVYFRKSRKEKLERMEVEQDAQNRECIANLIAGHHKSVLPEVAAASNKAFAEWQAYQKKMFRTAPEDRLALRSKYIDDRKFFAFWPEIKHEAPKKDLSSDRAIFMCDVFTEPFPSSYDMPEWALGTQITDIMILNGITSEESRKYCVHIKNHFVNHEMKTGIIQFDLYKPAA